MYPHMYITSASLYFSQVLCMYYIYPFLVIIIISLQKALVQQDIKSAVHKCVKVVSVCVAMCGGDQLDLRKTCVFRAFLLRLVPGLGNGSLHLVVSVLVHLLHESHQTGPWVFILAHLWCLWSERKALIHHVSEREGERENEKEKDIHMETKSDRYATHSLASFNFFSVAVRQDQSLAELFFKVTITVPLLSYIHTYTQRPEVSDGNFAS